MYTCRTDVYGDKQRQHMGRGCTCLTGNVTNPARVGRCLHVHDDGTCNWILIELKETFLKTGQYDIQTVPFSDESPTQGRLAIRTASDKVSFGNAGETYGSDWFQVIPSEGPGFTKSDSGSIVWAETTSAVTAHLSGVIGYHSRQSPVVKSQTALVSGLSQFLLKEGKEIAQQYVLIPRPKPAAPINPPYYTGRCQGDEYKNDSEPRGRAIIINNERFFVDRLPRRHGTQADVDALRGLLSKLHYDVEVIKNLETNEIKEEIERESQREDHNRFDSFILFLLSHGSRGAVYGTDGDRLPYDMIKKHFE
ncbi:uncharacterized protein LOC106171938 [Lingula anatina]|uniref:Uncharacterized protein LOC106171938 n=1 Tax=Lingula anatina TaxID=7574 RepID=A0A1S3JDG1_LINAN|nr:uncharacterized protein LOC106171938 [Lingula anatina]|eukprot:XP_013407924.1 uncharacterized protein LOC106171938 [Lingula anatina]